MSKATDIAAKKNKESKNKAAKSNNKQAGRVLSPEGQAFLRGDGSSPNLRQSALPFLMCMLAGTGSIILAGNLWPIILIIAVFFISLSSVVFKVRHDKAYDIQTTKGDIIGSFLSSFLFYAFISFSFAVASLVLYLAVFKPTP